MPLEVGAEIPDVALRTGAGTVETRGKPAVLYFFKSTCPSCALSFPYIDRLDRAFSDDAVGVWGVSQEDLPTAHEFMDRCSVNLPLVDDSALDASTAFDIQNVPTLCLLDADGRVQDVVVGHDKAGLNRVGETLAGWTGRSADVIAPEDDGAPAAQPG